MPAEIPQASQRHSVMPVMGGGEWGRAAPQGQTQALSFHRGSSYPEPTPLQVGAPISAGPQCPHVPRALPAWPRTLTHSCSTRYAGPRRQKRENNISFQPLGPGQLFSNSYETNWTLITAEKI